MEILRPAGRCEAHGPPGERMLEILTPGVGPCARGHIRRFFGVSRRETVLPTERDVSGRRHGTAGAD